MKLLPIFKTRRWLNVATLATLAMVLVVATAFAQDWVGNRVNDHDAWQPSDSTWVSGNAKGYTEGETAAIQIAVQADEDEHLQMDICIDFDVGGEYAYTGIEPWNTTYNPVLPGSAPITDMSDANVWANNATINSVTDLGEGGGLCPADYLAYHVDFTMDSGIGTGAQAYVVYGAHIAAPGDPLPGGGVVPVGEGASSVNGVFQVRLASNGTGDKTLNFKSGDIDPAFLLSGTVWDDANNNAMLEGGEATFAGVDVYLCPTAISPPNATDCRVTQTDANGFYVFSTPAVGDLYVSVDATQLPAGTNWFSSTGGGHDPIPTVDMDDGVPLGDGQFVNTQVFTVAADTNYPNIDFGFTDGDDHPTAVKLAGLSVTQTGAEWGTLLLVLAMLSIGSITGFLLYRSRTTV